MMPTKTKSNSTQPFQTVDYHTMHVEQREVSSNVTKLLLTKNPGQDYVERTVVYTHFSPVLKIIFKSNWESHIDREKSALSRMNRLISFRKSILFYLSAGSWDIAPPYIFPTAKKGKSILYYKNKVQDSKHLYFSDPEKSFLFSISKSKYAWDHFPLHDSSFLFVPGQTAFEEFKEPLLDHYKRYFSDASLTMEFSLAEANRRYQLF